MPGYLPRTVEPLLEQLLAELPAVSIVGPRATGKTTTASRLAASVVRLDEPGQAAIFDADPDAALRARAEPVLLDEWQAVPQVLGAVKRAVDEDTRPGRFILTGSVRAELKAEAWPGTGRVVMVPMFGLTVREQVGRLAGAPLFDRVARGEELEVPPDAPDLRGYVELALRSGFPEAIDLSDATRERWLEAYVSQLLTRDVDHLESGRDPVRLRRFLRAYALNSAGVVEDKTLFEASEINRKTANAYERLLANLFVVEAVPAWTSNRLKRLVLQPRRYLVDAGLIAGTLRVDVAAVMRDADLLGRLIDTFVTAQIRAELAVAETLPHLFHLRERQGRREIDLVGELGGGRVVAFEIKAHSAPGRDSARHLAWLRDQLADRFVGGVVLHTGKRTFPMGERIVAAPICTLWA
jgi:predicted AAA+ superfamily ATPase